MPISITAACCPSSCAADLPAASWRRAAPSISVPTCGEVTPIYTQADAIAALQSFSPVDYEKWVDVIPGVRARYWNAGHLLGSASIEIECTDRSAPEKALSILASGDIGPDSKLLQPDPEAPSGFDYVISESTYGDRERPPTSPDARRARLAA